MRIFHDNTKDDHSYTKGRQPPQRLQPQLRQLPGDIPRHRFPLCAAVPKSMITRYDSAIPLYQGLVRSFGYKARTLIKTQIVSLPAFLSGGAGGIEPPSESASAGTSPGAESPFYSLVRAWTLTLTESVASLCMVRSKLCALTFAANRRLASGPRPSRRRRSLLRQREEQSHCCSLIYNCPF